MRPPGKAMDAYGMHVKGTLGRVDAGGDRPSVTSVPYRCGSWVAAPAHPFIPRRPTLLSTASAQMPPALCATVICGLDDLWRGVAPTRPRSSHGSSRSG